MKLRAEVDGTLNDCDHGRIFDAAPTSATYYYFPSIAVNCASKTLLGFSGSSSNDHIGAYYTWRPTGGPAAEAPVLFREGTGYWNDYSWGDYSFKCVDPTDALSLWTVQEYATAEELWTTWIAKIKR